METCVLEISYMVVPFGFFVAASIAVYAVRQKRNASENTLQLSENDEADWTSLLFQNQEKEEKTEKEEKEKVKNKLTQFLEEEEEGNGFPEFDQLFTREIDFPLPQDEYEIMLNSKYETDMAIAKAELNQLRNMVKELEDREVKLEGELLEYYGLKDQESDILELQKEMKVKLDEINTLNITIKTLETERTKLHEEILSGISAKKELEATRILLNETQRHIQVEAGQTKGQLLMLKKQIADLQQKEHEETSKLDFEIEKKLMVMSELEVEVVELRRMNKELQHDKRELTMKLDTAESRASALFKMAENEKVTHSSSDIKKLRHANEDLAKQVEGLQTNRFSEVEELVYLRWVNACLRYELKEYQSPTGKLSARDLSKNLSPRSQDRAKRLMLEYTESERGHDTDFEGISSPPSSPGSDEFDDMSIDSSSTKISTLSRKKSFIQKFKKWGKNRDEHSPTSYPHRRSFGDPPMRTNLGGKSPAIIRGSLDALMRRNINDSMAITTYGTREDHPVESPRNPLVSVSESFQLMSKSVEGVAEDKYPAYKDRHKLALEREMVIKEKAEQARGQRFGDDQRNVVANIESKVKFGNPTPFVLASKPNQLKIVDEGTDIDNSPNINDPEALVMSRMKLTSIEKRPPKVFRPPPRLSSADSKVKDGIPLLPLPPIASPPGAPPPPPPPPPLPGTALKGSPGGKVHRAPELVELYQSLMKRETKNTASIASSPTNLLDARNNVIGEIQNQSVFLLAVKADVEAQGDFVNSLATEVRVASFSKIEDLVVFVNWLDEELSFLVDERAVLKHFDWPEGKTDALRESAFEYQDLMKLESLVSSFTDDPKLHCELALKKMYSLLEKMEQSVYALLRTRDTMISRCKEFGFPFDWLNDSGVVGKIKLASVQLARKYMKRVSTELDALGSSENETNRELLLLQGVRFAFRVHQFAGGFDADSMRAFEELRSRVNPATIHPQQKNLINE